MGDAWVCRKCGLDRYPECFPLSRFPVITSANPEHPQAVLDAVLARDRRRAAEDLLNQKGKK